jgi:hypothetical protein
MIIKEGYYVSRNKNFSTNTATFSYSGSEGSTMLGLPISVTGTGDIGSYSYGYNVRHWLDALEDTSKTDQEYAYSYSSSKELHNSITRTINACPKPLPIKN